MFVSCGRLVVVVFVSTKKITVCDWLVGSPIFIGSVVILFLSQNILKFVMGWLVVPYYSKTENMSVFCGSLVVVLFVFQEI